MPQQSWGTLTNGPTTRPTTTVGSGGTGDSSNSSSGGVRATVAQGLARMQQPLEQLKAQPTTLSDGGGDSQMHVVEL